MQNRPNPFSVLLRYEFKNLVHDFIPTIMIYVEFDDAILKFL